MIFDLKSGKRRRVVQVVFGFLAFVFFISFVGFGIGSNASGGIFDALGIGGGSNSSSDPQYEQQIEDAQSALETNPNDTRALLDLTRYHYLSAQQGISTDTSTGQTSISDDASAELEDAVAAWQRYLKTDPPKPSVDVANNAVQAYVQLNDAEGAAEAQRIIAEAQKSAPAYSQLAIYLYFEPDIKAGEAAAKQALAASDPASRKQLQKTLDAYAAQAEKFQKQLAKQRQQSQSSGGQGDTQENPFGTLPGGAGLGATPAPTP